jgi:putative endonuclease
MCTVDVLKSFKNGKRYVGFTSKSISTRLNWHRWGLTAWTKQNGPFQLIYSEQCTEKEKALKREKYFKTGQGRRTLDILIAQLPPQGVADPP